MTFKKLALASAIAMVPTIGFSVENLDDAMLSGVTGQDGIEVEINTNGAIGGDIYIHDKDGLTGTPSSTYSFDGAIVIDNFSIDASITLNIDAGDSAQAGSDPVLNVGVVLTGTTTINTGAISVANSERDDSGWGIATNTGTILSNTVITLGATNMNIQLGNEPQGNMIALDTVVTGGLTLTNFALNDAGGSLSGGAIGAASMTILDNGGTDLTVDAGVDLTSAGMVISLNQLGGTSGSGMDIRIVDQYLGQTATAGIIGDVTVVGLDLSGSTITISGK